MKDRTKFIQDTSLPSHGRRAKADNTGTIRVKVSYWPRIILPVEGVACGFDLHLNIDPASNTYHAMAETYDGPSLHILSKSVEVPPDILDGIVRLARRKEFMSLKDSDIFPGQIMLDGYYVSISVKSDKGDLSLCKSILEYTLMDGVIPTSIGCFHTPFHRLAAIGFKAFDMDSHDNLTTESVYTFQEDMRPASAKVYPIYRDDLVRDLLVLDGSRAWFLEMPAGEGNLDNYRVCVSGYNKYFKDLFGVETHVDLAMAFLDGYDRPSAMDSFLERIKGRKAFKVNDYRLTEASSELDRFIHQSAWKRGHVTQDFFMYWYQGVARHLLAAGLPEANVIDFFKKHRIQLGYIKVHGNGLTPETFVKRCLEKPREPVVYDEYAIPKVRVTKKMIASFRQELEQEYRKVREPDERIITEKFIQDRCYGVDDDYIADAIRHRQSPTDVVYWETL